MTTICFDGNQLAADTQVTKGHGMVMPGPFKKIHVPDDATEYWEANGVKVVAFALCGQAKAVDYIKEYLRLGITYKSRVEHLDELDFEALIITEKHDCFIWSVYANKDKRGEEQFLLPMAPPVASGSGSRFAMAAMCVKKNAEGAIRVAMKLDAFTGGNVDTFDLAPVPEVPSVRPEHLKPKVEEKEVKVEGEAKPEADKKDSKKK
jgi:hypothetical protein